MALYDDTAGGGACQGVSFTVCKPICPVGTNPVTCEGPPTVGETAGSNESGKLDQQLQTLVSEFGWDAALELYFTGVPTSRDALIQRTRVVARMVGSGKTGVSLSKAAALSRIAKSDPFTSIAKGAGAMGLGYAFLDATTSGKSAPNAVVVAAGGYAGGAGGATFVVTVCAAIGVPTAAIGMIPCAVVGGVAGSVVGQRAADALYQSLVRGGSRLTQTWVDAFARAGRGGR